MRMPGTVLRIALVAATLQMLADLSLAQKVPNEESPLQETNSRTQQDSAPLFLREEASPSSFSTAPSYLVVRPAEERSAILDASDGAETRSPEEAARFFEVEMTVKSLLLPDILMLFGFQMDGQNQHRPSYDDQPTLIERIVQFFVRMLMRM